MNATQLTYDELKKYKEYKWVMFHRRLRTVLYVLLMIFFWYICMNGTYTDIDAKTILALYAVMILFTLGLLYAIYLCFKKPIICYKGFIINTKKGTPQKIRKGEYYYPTLYGLQTEDGIIYGGDCTDYTKMRRHKKKLLIGDEIILFMFSEAEIFVFKAR